MVPPKALQNSVGQMERTVTNVDRTCGPTHLLVFSGNKICLN